jgi:hypothetical protein
MELATITLEGEEVVATGGGRGTRTMELATITLEGEEVVATQGQWN